MTWHRKVAQIDCNHCSKFAYKLDAGEGQGKPIMNGDQMIPVRYPPCHDDDQVCPKVRPGHSDFTEATSEIYWHWRIHRSLDEKDWPDEPEVRRFRRILDRIQEEFEDSKKEARMQDLYEAITRQVKRR